eukprot:CAMPEP_0116130788 /NCGR_PEP_ID=MMETSP0329-20121206/8663_1 /TAXON_ID=697910 /ORGANISM="Pseudo-nitzschia arenysensis, Strain B593" /LENGTH=644 /DNA_ID=CAMNT_0003625183 /DNA_START=70 /DNA_END=2004 /DNA_ORIENTATION=+
MNYNEYPLKDIPEPHSHDVLCGRGGGTNNHIGNSHWRMLVAANKQLYITLPKRQKMLLSRSIVNAVRSQNPPGRFLQKDGKTKLWFDVGDQRAQEKTSQALREGAPDIRKKVAAAKVSSGSTDSTPPAATTSGETSNSGAKTDGVGKPQIPGTSGDRKPESAGSSSMMPPAAGTSDGMLEPIPTPEIQIQQQYNIQQQQMNGMFGGHNATGHMTLNERGMLIQNAMMNGTQGLNGHNHQQMNNNGNNFNQAAFMFQQQQQQQQQQGHMQRQMHHQQDFQQQYHYQQQQLNNNMNFQQQQQQQQQQQHQFQQQQQYHGNSNVRMANYENFDAPPPEELDRDGLSFGSLHMTDAEMHNLQQGSTHGPNKNRRHSISKSRASMGSNASDPKNKNIPGAPMGGVLEPTGISLGDVSMHSTLSNYKMTLEENGASFGTMMSYNTLNTTNHSMNPEMVDGGLMDAVGTSFGSLSLDKNNRDMLFKTLEIAGGGSEVPPMFRSETKASANLLDCSDTESESSREKEELTKQKSQAWEMMKTQLDKQTSKGASVNSQDLMPPPVGVPQSSNNNKGSENANKHAFDNIEIALPPTTMEANFSTLSAWSATDDYNESGPAVKTEQAQKSGGKDDDSDAVAVPPPPPELTKVDSF